MENENEIIYKIFSYSTHLLIAGTTGSGKSTVINNTLRLFGKRKEPGAPAVVLIDPKRVELREWKEKLNCLGYCTEAADALSLLRAVNREIDRRYKKMARRGGKMWGGQQLYVVIDELADLLLAREKKEISRELQRTLQLGRAAGVHVIAATQVPNRRVLPAEIVLNFTDRLALRCLSAIESRQIINVKGAEDLPRYGRGIYLSPAGMLPVALPLIAEVEEAPPKKSRREKRREKKIAKKAAAR